MKAFFLTFLITLSCTKYAQFSSEGVSRSLKSVEMPVSDLDEISWAVGKWKDSKVTQSVTFIVSLPKLSQEDFEKIQNQTNMNAWILRLIVNQNNKSKDLGPLYVPLGSKKVLRGQAYSFPSSIALKIYYSAAFPSERFRFSNCPAFNHRKRITKLNIKNDNSTFDLSFDQTINYPEKAQLVEFAPTAFNGGDTLTGEYFVEIAPYNVENKTILGPFKRIPQYIDISEEELINVPSCEGVHPENQ
jgi:hypothetical protein